VAYNQEGHLLNIFTFIIRERGRLSERAFKGKSGYSMHIILENLYDKFAGKNTLYTFLKNGRTLSEQKLPREIFSRYIYYFFNFMRFRVVRLVHDCFCKQLRILVRSQVTYFLVKM